MESWPRIIPFSSYKPIIPTFEDYYCDHNCCKDAIKLRKLSITNIISSKEYQSYDTQMNDIADLIDRIQKEASDYRFDDEIANIENMSDTMIALIQSINKRIIAINSEPITCERCEATVRKYERIKRVALSNTADRKDHDQSELVESINSIDAIDQSTHSDSRIGLFIKWLNSNHPNATRIEITKDFKIAYRRHFGEAVKIEDIAELFRSTGSWLVNHNANKWYAVSKA